MCAGAHVASALGSAAGLVITLFVVRASGITGLVVVVPPLLMVGVFVLTVAMCVTASIVSVRKALRVDPLVVFRA